MKTISNYGQGKNVNTNSDFVRTYSYENNQWKPRWTPSGFCRDCINFTGL